MRHLILAAPLLGLAPAALAVPLELSHSVRLLDADGAPRQGAHALTLSLYDSPTGGAPRWTETATVTLEDGYATLRLGADPANPLDTTAIADGDALWLGVRVGAEPELPTRSPVGSAMYALRAEVASRVEGGPVATSTVTATGQVSAAAVRVADPGSTCTPAEAGVIRFAGGQFQGCTGSGWVTLRADGDTPPTAGTHITVSGAQVSVDTSWVAVRQRIARYQATCAALAGSAYNNVAAVTPGSSAVNLTGSQVCANYVGNNNNTSWTCISVPYVYNDHGTGAYLGTDVRPTWRACNVTTGPSGGYPWLDPDAGTGTMMACCVK
jgi:hypothetical protein